MKFGSEISMRKVIARCSTFSSFISIKYIAHICTRTMAEKLHPNIPTQKHIDKICEQSDKFLNEKIMSFQHNTLTFHEIA